MSVLGDLIGEAIGTFLFFTGEVLLKLVTLGDHRVRWWEVEDPKVTWPTTLLGLAFWLGVGGLVFILLS